MGAPCEVGAENPSMSRHENAPLGEPGRAGEVL